MHIYDYEKILENSQWKDEPEYEAIKILLAECDYLKNELEKAKNKKGESMKIILNIDPATDKTCGSGDGKFCPHLLTRRFGSETFCGVFNKELEVVSEWTQRLPECIKATKNSLT